MSTINILSLDGGGMRGYISALFLQKFVAMWGVDPSQLYKQFDVIAGTSVGGIQALGYAYGMTPTDLQNFFIEDGPWIFSTSSTTPGIRATTLDKISTMVFGGSFYSNANLIARLNDEFGTETLQDMKTNVLITSCNYNLNNPSYAQKAIPILFSNANVPGYTGRNQLAADVALATASAPLYFPAANFNKLNFVDGGIIQNNPVQLALSLGQALYPQADRYCVLSVGTGIGDIGFPPSATLPPSSSSLRMETRKLEEALFKGSPRLAFTRPVTDKQIDILLQMQENGTFDNMYVLMDLIDIEIAGPQEAMAFNLGIQANLTLQNNIYYYRFNLGLDPNQDTEMDNTSAEFMEYMETATAQRINDDIDRITNFIGHLTS